MTQVLVRNLDRDTLESLKRRARRHGRSLQQELKTILEDASRPEISDALSVAKTIREKLRKRRSSYSDTGKMQSSDRLR
jgi:plasmid stability protein